MKQSQRKVVSDSTLYPRTQHKGRQLAVRLKLWVNLRASWTEIKLNLVNSRHHTTDRQPHKGILEQKNRAWDRRQIVINWQHRKGILGQKSRVWAWRQKGINRNLIKLSKNSSIGNRHQKELQAIKRYMIKTVSNSLIKKTHSVILQVVKAECVWGRLKARWLWRKLSLTKHPTVWIRLVSKRSSLMRHKPSFQEKIKSDREKTRKAKLPICKRLLSLAKLMASDNARTTNSTSSPNPKLRTERISQARASLQRASLTITPSTALKTEGRLHPQKNQLRR